MPTILQKSVDAVGRSLCNAIQTVEVVKAENKKINKQTKQKISESEIKINDIISL